MSILLLLVVVVLLDGIPVESWKAGKPVESGFSFSPIRMIILIVVCNTIAIIDTSLFIFIMVSVQIEKSSILCEC